MASVRFTTGRLNVALLVVLCIEGVFSEYNEYEEISDWGYGAENGPCSWKKNYPMCKGRKQSPIALHHKTTTHVCGPPLHWFNYNSMPCTVLVGNNGRTLILRGVWDCRDPPSVKLGNCTYVFENVHFHWGSSNDKGSEHTIDGERFPLEMQVVHVKRLAPDKRETPGDSLEREARASSSNTTTTTSGTTDDHEVLVLVYLFRVCDEDKTSCRQKGCYDSGSPEHETIHHVTDIDTQAELTNQENEEGHHIRAKQSYSVDAPCPHRPKGGVACDDCNRKAVHEKAERLHQSASTNSNKILDEDYNSNDPSENENSSGNFNHYSNVLAGGNKGDYGNGRGKNENTDNDNVNPDSTENSNTIGQIDYNSNPYSSGRTSAHSNNLSKGNTRSNERIKVNTHSNEHIFKSENERNDIEDNEEGSGDPNDSGKNVLSCIDKSRSKCPNPNAYANIMEQFSLNNVVREFCKVKRAGSTVSVDPFPVSTVIPHFERNFFLYKGSLTTPPCTENTLYAVSAKILCISAHELNAFRQLLAGGNIALLDNFRPLQRRCHRPINLVVSNTQPGLECPLETSTEESPPETNSQSQP